MIRPINNNSGGTAIHTVWVAVLSAMVLAGAWVALLVLTQGLEMMKVDFRIPWTLSIAVYVFFAVSCTGLCMVNSFLNLGVGGIGKLRAADWRKVAHGPIGRTCVMLSILTLLAGFVAIGLHLGRVERMPLSMLTPNPASPIFGMGVAYTFYLVFIIAEFFFMQKDDHRRAKLFGALSLFSGFIAVSTLGSVFGFLESRPLWHGPFMPMFLVLSAMFTGIAWLALITVLTYKVMGQEPEAGIKEVMLGLGRLMAFLLAVGLLFIGANLAAAVTGSPEKAAAAAQLLNGPFAFSFWTFEIIIGMLIPIALLTLPVVRESLGAMALAAVCVLTGIFMMRFDFVTAGQVYPSGVFLESYTPKTPEVILTAALFAFVLLAFTLTRRYTLLSQS